MGNNRSKNFTYYDPTVNATLFDQTSTCKFFRNQRGEQFEMYQVENQGNADFQNRYDYRIKNSSPYLVEAFSLKTKENTFGCASGHIYEVVIQRIPSRLHDLINIPTLQSLNIINRSLKGFQQIFKSQGVLLVKDSMIGINKQNEVKVWMNSNFSLNQIQTPPISYGFLPEIQKESTMVDNIVELVNSRVRRDQEWQTFVTKKYSQGRIGFDEAIKLTELYTQKISQKSRVREGTQESRVQINENYGKSNVNGNRHSILSSNFQQQNQRSRAKSFGIGELASSFNQNNQTLNTFGQQKITSPVYKTSTMSNLKNKIIKGTNQSNEVQNHYVPSVIRPSPIQLNAKSQLTPQNNVNFNGFKPSPILSKGYQAAPNQQVLRPRSFSEGKPIVTFGNGSGSFQYSPSTPFNQQISFKPAFAPNHQINQQRRYENIQKPNFHQQISNNQNEKTNYQNPKINSGFIPQIPQINNNINTFRESNQNFSIQRPVSQLLPQKYQTNPQNNPNQAVKQFQNPSLIQKFSQPTKIQKAQIPPLIQQQPLVSKNQNVLNNLNQKETKIQIVQTNDKNKLENNIDLFTQSVHIPNNYNNDHSYAESSYYHVPQVLQNDHDPSVKASMESVQRQTKYQRKDQSVPETPFFAKQKLEKEEAPNHKVIPNNIKRKIQSQISESQQDRILEMEQEQLKQLKQSKNTLKAQNYERSIRESAGSESSKVNINYNLVASQNSSLKGSNKIQQPFQESVKIVELKNGNGKFTKNEEKIAQKEVTVRQLSRGNMEDSKKFKQAVHESASNIRLETSKISIKSSSDLKGIISYKDLRDILKSTRKGQF